MQSAAITTISRLIYEFSSNLCQVILDILPLVFELLKTRSREIVKIVARRSTKHLKSLVDGLLLWINDSKNRFKAKVVSFVNVAWMWSLLFVPEEHAKLLKNICKKRDALEKN